MVQLNLTEDAIHFRNLDEHKKQFEACHCSLFPKFLSDEVLRKILPNLEGGTFVARSYGTDVGAESVMKENKGWNLLHFLMNAPNLFNAVKEITGVSQVGFFSGRIYRMEPEEEHYLDWHNDLKYGRQLAVSINLSQKIYEGARLQIRSARTQKIFYNAGALNPGDALLFRVSPDLEHRLTEIKGTHPRIAYAGWFYPKPQTAWFKKTHKRILHASH